MAIIKNTQDKSWTLSAILFLNMKKKIVKKPSNQNIAPDAHIEGTSLRKYESRPADNQVIT
jgi:hypothetical protein